MNIWSLRNEVIAILINFPTLRQDPKLFNEIIFLQIIALSSKYFNPYRIGFGFPFVGVEYRLEEAKKDGTVGVHIPSKCLTRETYQLESPDLKPFMKYFESTKWELTRGRLILRVDYKVIIHKLIPSFIYAIRSMSSLSVRNVQRSLGVFNIHSLPSDPPDDLPIVRTLDADSRERRLGEVMTTVKSLRARA